MHPSAVSGQRGEARGRLSAGRVPGEEEEGERRGRGLQPVLAGPARRGQCRRRGRSPMRPLRGCRRRGAIVGTVTLCLAAGWALQSKCCPFPFPPPACTVGAHRSWPGRGRWSRRGRIRALGATFALRAAALLLRPDRFR